MQEVLELSAKKSERGRKKREKEQNKSKAHKRQRRIDQHTVMLLSVIF